MNRPVGACPVASGNPVALKLPRDLPRFGATIYVDRAAHVTRRLVVGARAAGAGGDDVGARGRRPDSQMIVQAPRLSAARNNAALVERARVRRRGGGVADRVTPGRRQALGLALL